MSLSIIIPVYNGASSLPTLLERLAPVLQKCASEYEVILIEDGSLDNSWETICQQKSTYPWLRAFRLTRNYGQHNALLCGVRAARYAIIVTMDDDLQHPPEEVSKLLRKLDEGYDVVYGSPHVEQHGLWRNLASQMTKIALRKVMGAETARHASAFRAFRRHVRRAFADYHGMFVNIDVLLTWGTSRFAAIDVRHEPRAQGASNYTFRKLVTHALNMITGFTTIPLQLASLLGFMMTIFGLLLLIYLLVNRLVLGNDVPGFTFLASVVVIFSGAQMLALGIIGEYLARMHFRLMDRPVYTVHEELEAVDDE